jgi:hypothetical protein
MLAAQVASELTAKPVRLPIYLFGRVSVVAGILDLVGGGFEAAQQPIRGLGDNVPGQVFLACIVAALLIDGGTV